MKLFWVGICDNLTFQNQLKRVSSDYKRKTLGFGQCSTFRFPFCLFTLFRIGVK